MIYTKDKGQFADPKNYAEIFGLPLNNTHLLLINSTQYALKDKIGVYVYDAVSYDNLGNVSFTKRYINN
jgi:hypothetical protein